MNIIIVGDPGSGKSTLIKKLLDHIHLVTYGIVTLKESADKYGNESVYIYDINKEHFQTAQNLIGIVSAQGASGYPEVFDREGVRLLSNIPPQSVVVIDELGFMENNALLFQKSVMNILDSDHLVIAAVKPKQTAFLDAVREHEKSRVFWLDKNNRDQVFAEIMVMIKHAYMSDY
jgi:nucleoside-triphosphatase